MLHASINDSSASGEFEECFTKAAVAGSPVEDLLKPDGKSCDEGVDADLGAISELVFDRFSGASVGEKEIGDELPDGLGFSVDRGALRQTWRHVVTILPPRLDVAEGQLAGLVKGDPPSNFRAETGSDFFRVASE